MSCKDFEKSAKVIETKWLVGAFFDDFSALCSIVRAARRERNSGTLMGEAGRAATFVWIRKGDSDCWRLTRYNSAFIGHMSMITCGLFESGLWKFIRTVGKTEGERQRQRVKCFALCDDWTAGRARAQLRLGHLRI
jgi:hypothetical protein